MREITLNQPSSQIEKQGEKKELLDFILKRSEELGPEMKKEYTCFHENPELGGEEFETAKRVKRYLENLGIEIIGKGIGSETISKMAKHIKGDEIAPTGTGIVARIKGKEEGPTIALRADMDALPDIQENKENFPRSKKEGIMHACGHDAHTAGLLGAAKILKEMADKEKLEGDAILIFQPSEEKTHQKQSGAVSIVSFLEGKGLRKRIDAFFALHVQGLEERGSVAIKEGVQFPSSGEIDIILKAPGGHIINVYETPSLQTIFSKVTLRLEELFKPLWKTEEAMVGSGRTKYGGSGYNTLPAEAESTWVVRVISPNYKKISKNIAADIKNVVKEVVNEHIGDIKKETGRDDIDDVEIDIKTRHGYRPVIHRSPELVDIADKSASQVIKNYQRSDKLVMAGDDFSFYLEKFRGVEIPGVYAKLGAVNPEKGFPKTRHHNKNFKIDPDTIKDLAALYSNFTINAIDYFKQKKEKDN